jgi:hypothetical protein
MNKPLLGLLLGGTLGLVDGLSALWDAQYDPEVRAGIAGIVIGSTFKGLVAGVATGWFARKVHSLMWGVLFGLLVSGALAFLVAALQDKYYLRITLPGAILGAIVGYATQQYGARRAAAPLEA